MTPCPILAYRHWAPAVVLVLGVLSTAMVFWTYRIIERQWASFDLVNAIVHIRLGTASFHLRLGEAVADGRTDNAERIMPDLDTAVTLSHALLYGGYSGLGMPMSPLAAPSLRRHAETLTVRLGEYKAIALERIADPGSSPIGSAREKRFNAVFEQLQAAARAFETSAEKSLLEEYEKSERLFLAILVLWTLLVAVSTAGLYSRERRRRSAEMALETAYDEMEQRVRSRTADLKQANEMLQAEIAERRRTEEHLRQSEEECRGLSLQFKTLLEAIPDRITLISRDLKVRWTNRQATDLSVAAAEDNACEFCHTFWYQRSTLCDGCPGTATFFTGKTENARISTPDGRQWDVRTVPIVDDRGTIENVLEVATDVTEKVSLQVETMRTAHLAAIGELAAGVAHEINNPINGIINYARILCDDHGSKEGKSLEILNRILKEARRIAEIVKDLLLFARGGKKDKQLVRVGEILSDSLRLMGSELKHDGIQVATVLPADLPEIKVDPQEIQRVFMNIISNARYALNQKHPEPHEQKRLCIHGEKLTINESPYVRIAFQDQGVGIPTAIMDKIREPFFSTKPRGNGTGLGLTISDGIIRNHGGTLTIESVEGEFTDIVIDLPAREVDSGKDSCC